jgi:adenylate kinase family enzyme
MRRYLSFLGPPGCGKTTQIELLAELLSPRLIVASVPRLLRGQEDLVTMLTPAEVAELEGLSQASAAARSRGDLAPLAVDRLLFSALARLPAQGFVALDGCPRGMAQARLFLETGNLASQTLVVELRFPEHTPASSFLRQIERETEKRGTEEALAKLAVFARKTQVFLNDTSAGLCLLRDAGIPSLTFDATVKADSIHAQIRDAIGAMPSSLTSMIAAGT